MPRPHIVLLRGTAVNPWDLRAWEELTDDYDVCVVVPNNNEFDTSGVRLRQREIATAGGIASRLGRAGKLAVRGVGERYVGLADALVGADIVHAAELGTWYAAQAARLRQDLGFRLALTVWETLPFVDAYRNVRTRPYRRLVREATDLFLPTTERAREALLLEGADPARIRVVLPGAVMDGAGDPVKPAGHAPPLVLSVGRLVWEKGHQDVLRAVALLRRRGRPDLRVMIVGTGPERRRLEAVIRDLSLTDVAELRGWVPHHEMAELYRRASCLVLASLPTWSWEEQFGMVLIEAIAAGLPICASSSGAIPEVLDGAGTLFTPGDWVGLGDALAAGPLASNAPRPSYSALRQRYSIDAAATRIRSAYETLLQT